MDDISVLIYKTVAYVNSGIVRYLDSFLSFQYWRILWPILHGIATLEDVVMSNS